MKTCTRCKTEKPLSEFYADNRRKDGKLSRCKTCKNEMLRQYRKERGYDHRRYWKNPAGERERHLKAKYGITQADYDMMFKVQEGKCAVCRKEQSRAFDVDHCHTTGVVRGLLCTNCNRMIGHAADDPIRLQNAAAYLLASRKSRRPSSKR